MEANEIERKIAQINPKVKTNKKVVDILINGMVENEELLHITTGTTLCKSNMPNTNDIVKSATIFVTNKRVFLAVKNIFSYDSVNIPLESVRRISSNKVLFATQVLINNGSTDTIIGISSKQEANNFINVLNKQIDNYKSFKIEVNKTVERDITDKIEKLSDLYKDGVLTEYEFAMKKMELLEKLKK